ncbi:hypothetical protein [Streptomyces sp. NPDC059761]|uniref:hypothetical protein n=1 Tax=Streptomyces sp. NPDC059761 TaxID=3346937 RepID=UPI0036544430
MPRAVATSSPTRRARSSDVQPRTRGRDNAFICQPDSGQVDRPDRHAPRVTEPLRETAAAGDLIEVAWNPGFLRESFAIEDTLRPDRLVLGFNTDAPWAEAQLWQAFAKIIESGSPTIVVTDWATTEPTKGPLEYRVVVAVDRRPALGVCAAACFAVPAAAALEPTSRRFARTPAEDECV